MDNLLQLAIGQLDAVLLVVVITQKQSAQQISKFHWQPSVQTM
jgi:hypothetical protein